VEILNLGGASEEVPTPNKSRKPNKKFKIALGIGVLAVMTGLGSTLAANISLNGGAPVEFGQGVAITAACNGDTPITLTPTSTFTNTEDAETSKFTLSGVAISGIQFSTTDPTGFGCAGKTFILKAYTDQTQFETLTQGQNNTSSPLYMTGTRNTAIAFTIDNMGAITHAYVAKVDGNKDDVLIGYNEAGGVTITLTNGVDSRAVSKFTLETIDTPPSGLLDTTNDWRKSLHQRQQEKQLQE
jgi:hypothetical protein